MSNPTAVTEASDVMEVIVRALERPEKPISTKELRKGLSGPYKLSEARLEPVLAELVSAGRIYRFAPSRGKSPWYWAHDHEHWARVVMRQAVAGKPQTSIAWQRSAKSKLKGMSDDHLRAIREELLSAREVYKWPPQRGSRSEKYHTTAPDPAAYLREPLQKIAAQLEAAGVTRVQILEAVEKLLREPASEPQPAHAPELIAEAPPHAAPTPQPPPPPAPPQPADELGQRIIDRMHEINPQAASGALVSLRDLWRSMQFQVPDKHTFEEAVRQLAREGRVALHRHDYPDRLSAEERADMIADGSGGFFVGMALRT